MLRNYIKICNPAQINKLLKSCASTEAKEKWDILTSVCLERKPIISPGLSELEIEFQKYLSQVELERSLKSDHEIRHENDKKQAALLKTADTADLDVASVQTAQDFEDACTEELTKFKFASRETEDDIKNDLKSLERKLDKHLVLLIQQQIGAKNYFLPPQGIRQDGETLKQAAQRLLNSFCGPEIKTQIYGNAPAGFYKYKYPKDVQKNGVVGAKVFIYFARHLKGQLENKSNYKWMDRSEMAKEIPEDYYKSITKFLIDETQVTNKIKQSSRQ